MKKLFIILIIISTLIIGGNNAFAAWSFHLDNADMDNVFDIWFFTDESVVVSNYQLNFEYDIGELDYQGIFTNTPPSGLIGQVIGGNPTFDNTLGVLNNFNAGALPGQPGVSVDSDIQLGTLTFNIDSGAVMDGEDDLLFASTPGFGITLDGTFYNWVNFQDSAFAAEHLSYGDGLDVGNPVPVPAAVWLLGSGLIGRIGMRRRQR
jgi:hypothetical protein